MLQNDDSDVFLTCSRVLQQQSQQTKKALFSKFIQIENYPFNQNYKTEIQNLKYFSIILQTFINQLPKHLNYFETFQKHFIYSLNQIVMSFQIQQQIKRNAEEIRSYVGDLYSWEEEMMLKEKAKQKVLKEERARQEEIRQRLEAQNAQKKKQSQNQSKNSKQQQQQPSKQKKPDLVRDTTTIKAYYNAWDKFDADKQYQRLQQQQKKVYKPYNPYQSSQNYIRAKPKAKVNVSVNRQRTAVIDPTQLKDKGNLHYKVCQYPKAIQSYTQCLQKLQQQQQSQANNKLKCVVLSNRAMTYMKLNQNSKALKDCTQSLSYDNSYLKSYLRRAQCNRKLNNYLQSLSDYKKVKELDPSDTQVEKEIRKIQKYLERLYKEARESLVVRAMPEKGWRVNVEEVGEVGDWVDGKGKKQEKKVNYLEEL